MNNPLRYTVWEDLANGPRVLTEADFENVIHGSAFFARKIEEPVSKSMMDQLDAYCQFHIDRK